MPTPHLRVNRYAPFPNLYSKKRPAAFEPAEPDEQATPDQETDQKYGDAQIRGQCTTCFKRVAAGHASKVSESEVDQAQQALETYDQLDTPDKTAFAKAFFSNKGGKKIGFIKDYAEELQSGKKVKEKVGENYYTRIAPPFNSWEFPSQFQKHTYVKKLGFYDRDMK